MNFLQKIGDFEKRLCTMTFGLMYGQYSRVVFNQEQVLVVGVWYINVYHDVMAFKQL